MQSETGTNFEIAATPRIGSGKGAARRARRAGRIPALVAGAGKTVLFDIDRTAVEEIFRRSNDRNVFVTVKADGVSYPCLLREIQRHPVSRSIEHIDFFDVSAAKQVSVSVPVEAVGRAAGTRAGGLLRLLARKLDVRCSPTAIPRTLAVDVTALEIGRFIRASDVVPPEGVQVVYRKDFNVLTVEGKRGAVEAPAAEGADAKAPAAKAPAAKAAAKAAPAKAAPAKAAPAKK